MRRLSRFVVGAIFFAGQVQAAPLTLQDFLAQVKEKNFGVKASSKQSQGLELRSNEGIGLYSPVFVAQAARLTDKSEQSIPTFSGTQTQATTYSVGIKQLTPWGLAGQIDYDIKHVDISGSVQNPANYYMASPNIEGSLSLWRNLFGSETRAQEAVISAGNRAGAAGAAFQERALLLAAEQAYWRLALARENLRVQKNVLDRGERLQDWATRRVRMQLGDRSDLLQANAAVDIRKIDVQFAEEELRAASLHFNQTLDRAGQTVPEEVVLPDMKELEALKVGTRGEERLDVTAAREQAAAATAAAQLVKESGKPNVELFGSYARNGKDPLFPTAKTESWTDKYPVTTVGIRLAVPLAFGTAYKTYKGTNLQQEAAALEFEKKQSETNAEWEDVLARFKAAQGRLSLAIQVEKTQKEKLDAEKDRLLRGRTTTYQTILFEQDYSQAMLLRLRTQSELLSSYAQLKLFGDSSW